MGYGAYRWAQRLNSTTWKMIRRPAGLLLKHGSGRHKRIAEMLLHDGVNLHSHIFSQEQYFFSASEIRELLIESTAFKGIPVELSGIPGNFSPAGQQAYYDLTHYLKDDLLVKVDRASMHYSLETRVPLLDYRIVEFALNLSEELKLHNDTTKYLLKKILYSYLPEELFRRPKWGFALPMRKWLKGRLKDWMSDSLSEETIRRHGLVKPEAVRELLRRYLETNAEYLYNRLWALVILHNFLERAK
jgi:asparagine synthase (glutamine-hydrolysing)